MRRSTRVRAGGGIVRAVVGLPALALALLARTAGADDFASAHYEADRDQIVVTVRYRGTQAHHPFSLAWGPCRRERGEPTVSVDVLDGEYRDAARHDYVETLRFDLQGMPCRPARIVLHLEPRAYLEVRVPATP